ncbi:hypothetical protein ACLOJK_019532 [Asimina triloba]
MNEADDSTLRRFLRARDLDVKKASCQFLKYLKWRQAFVPKGFISEPEIEKQLADGKVFMQGCDKKGRCIVIIFGAKHFSYKRDLDELKRIKFHSTKLWKQMQQSDNPIAWTSFVVYTLDKVCASLPSGLGKFIVIADLDGWGYSNCDIRAYVAALEIMQDCYPERLGKLYIVHAPSIFMASWKMVYPFIDNNTRKKIVFLGNKELKATLLEDIEESELPETYGGKMTLIPIQDSKIYA